jgi:hypothetical protein
VNFPETNRDNSFVARLWATQRVGYLSAEKRRSGGSREIDDEIRQLGERYSIPTEFTSYLVVEPQMRRQAAGLSNVVVTGTATAAAAPPPSANAKAFEAARDAAQMRAATNISAAPERLQDADARAVQRAGTHTFVLRDGIWTDAAASDSMNRIKVKPFSTAYFKLIDAIPELREIVAISDKIIIAGKGVSIEITSAGVETLSEADFKRVLTQW